MQNKPWEASMNALLRGKTSPGKRDEASMNALLRGYSHILSYFIIFSIICVLYSIPIHLLCTSASTGCPAETKMKYRKHQKTLSEVWIELWHNII